MQAIHINTFELEPVAQQQPQRFQKVFLIDNNALDCLNNTALLTRHDFSEELEIFESASSALNMLSGAKRLNEIPDMIFINLNMPGMDGYTFLNSFNNLNDFARKRCKIVVLADDCNERDRQKCLMNRNVVQYFPKQLNDRMIEQFTN